MIPVVDLTPDSETLEKMLLAIKGVLGSNSFILGKQLEEFEQRFGQFIGCEHACGVASGTDALRLSLQALGIGRGDKVLTVSFTSPFTIVAILEAGATPVFCDINEDTWTIDVDDAKRKMDSKVKAIIPVHIYGNPCDMGKILDFSRDSKIKVIEDACQAHGAMIGKKFIGTFGDTAAFSFYPTKNLGAFGDGGAITTNSKKVFETLKVLRHGGQTGRFWHKLVAGHSRLDEIQAAILKIKLSRLLEDNKKRSLIANKYREELAGPRIKFQKVLSGAKSANHLFVITTKERDKLKTYLALHGISSDVHYPYPTYRQPVFSMFAKERLDVTEDVQSKILSLPIYPNLKERDQEKIILHIQNFFNGER